LTAIVGVINKGIVHLGADSAGSTCYDLRIHTDPKVFTNGPFVFGFTSSFRMGQLLHYAFDPPAPTKNLAKFMSTKFVDGVRETLKAGGFAAKSNEVEAGGTFLVGVRGRLFAIYSDYQVAEEALDYMAVGSGEDIALGALYATADLGLSPRARMRIALKAAARFKTGVHEPFVYASTPE